MACKHGNPVYKCVDCAAERLAALPTPKPAPETGWVIEHRSSEPCAPRYWAGNGWMPDHMRAIRFARKLDAERTVSGFDEDDPLPTEKPHRVCEHAWG